MELFSGIILGLLGSFHCIGMCGPIALSLPSGSKSKRSFIAGRLLYNSGRIISYSVIGLIFGFLGSRIYLFGLQQSLSVILGTVILLSVIVSFKRKNILSKNKYFNKLFLRYKNLFSNILHKKSKPSLLLIGILNGFLPCGFVYFALSGALISGEPFTGSLYMMLFGIGTIPLMLAVSVSGNFMNLSLRRKINKFIPAFTILIALILILRGMNLDIPYLSPKISHANESSNELLCK